MTSSICYLGWIHYDFYHKDWFQEKDALSFYSLFFLDIFILYKENWKLYIL